jgi:predicted anti-sigma-YlaC factor YlaD
MLNLVPPTDCAEAREAASARLDDELSELEAAGLDVHLLACSDCRAYATAIAGIATQLQTAALEQPSPWLGKSHRLRSRMPVTAAAAAVAAAVIVSSFAVGGLLGAGSAPKRAVAARTDVLRLRQDSVQQHLLAMLNSFEAPQPRTGRRMRAV